jgi:hypothetical protein
VWQETTSQCVSWCDNWTLAGGFTCIIPAAFADFAAIFAAFAAALADLAASAASSAAFKALAARAASASARLRSNLLGLKIA